MPSSSCLCSSWFCHSLISVFYNCYYTAELHCFHLLCIHGNHLHLLFGFGGFLKSTRWGHCRGCYSVHTKAFPLFNAYPIWLWMVDCGLTVSAFQPVKNRVQVFAQPSRTSVKAVCYCSYDWRMHTWCCAHCVARRCWGQPRRSEMNK